MQDRHKVQGEVQRVLVYRLGSLGDTIAALPCFHLVRRCFPSAERRVLTNQPVSGKAAPLDAVLDGGAFIDGVIEYPVSLRSPKALLRLRGRIADYAPDVLVYLAANRGALALRRDLLFFRLCGVRKIVGAPLSRDLRLPRRDPEGLLEQESRRLARTLVELGDIDVDAPGAFDLRLQPGEEALASEALAPLDGAPFLALNTGGKAAQKDWGEPNWAALLAQLSERRRGRLALVFIGGAEDADRAARLTRAWSGPALDLCGRLSPRASGAVLRRAQAFAGHDSGPLHLAAAVGAPSLGLFGDYNQPRMWWPCGPNVAIIHNSRGVRAITVDDVFARLQELAGAP